MGFFNKLFGKKNEEILEEKSVNRCTLFDNSESLNKGDWSLVYSASLGPMLAVQEAIGTHVVKSRNWNIDFVKQVIYFGDDEYNIKLIGSESNTSNTWLWGYENVNGFDEGLLTFANEIRQFGGTNELTAFNISKFDLDEYYNGHTLSTAACLVASGDYGYYRCPHDGGAVFVALTNLPSKVFEPVDGQAFARHVMNALDIQLVEHLTFVEGFLKWNGTEYEKNGYTIIAKFETDYLIEFEKVDGFFRVVSVKTASL